MYTIFNRDAKVYIVGGSMNSHNLHINVNEHILI